MRRIAMGIVFGSLLIGVSPLAAAACWVPVQTGSTIEFTTTQAGAPFQGEFKKFDGLVCVDRDHDQDRHIRVSIQTASVDTGLPELDDALRGPDFFDTVHWPQASFTSESVKALDAGHYQVTGKLTLRDVTREISVPFTFTMTAGGTARLQGKLDFQRLDYHIGLGQWSDTHWVGNPVEVKFLIMLMPAGEHPEGGQTGPRHFWID